MFELKLSGTEVSKDIIIEKAAWQCIHPAVIYDRFLSWTTSFLWKGKGGRLRAEIDPAIHACVEFSQLTRSVFKRVSWPSGPHFKMIKPTAQSQNIIMTYKMAQVLALAFWGTKQRNISRTDALEF